MKKGSNQLQLEKYKSCKKDCLFRKGSYNIKYDSTDETNYSTNETNEIKFDFLIPDFLNDKPKIYYRINYLYPLIPEWYLNLNKHYIDLSNENFDDELLFS